MPREHVINGPSSNFCGQATESGNDNEERTVWEQREALVREKPTKENKTTRSQTKFEP